MAASTLLVALLLGASPSLDQGIARYDALEFESAITALKKAETEAVSLADRVKVQLYLGLTYSELAQWKNAESAFRNTLVLDPTAEIPIKTSPKIEKLFADLRAQFAAAAEASAGSPPDGSPRVAVTDAPLPRDGGAVEADTSPASVLPLRPILLMGGGALVAGGGLALGLASRSSSAAARDEPIQVTAASQVDSAKNQAIAANVFFAAATSLAIAAVVYYLLPSKEDER